MKNRLLTLFMRVWKPSLLILCVVILEFAVSPLGKGPDRRIHDPAVTRRTNPAALTGDWYTDMAVSSGVYRFYAPLVSFCEKIGLSDERWRQLLFLASLVILYYSLYKITRLFLESRLTLPITAVLHAGMMTVARPIWLYGPFIQVDGGFAPRSLGVAGSFLALYHLLKGSRALPWLILGLATLIHASNSFIVFCLFFGCWIIFKLVHSTKEQRSTLIKDSCIAIVVYLLAGGWFALFIALQSAGGGTFSAQKFIWTWIYFRAPYMALPTISWKMQALLVAHVAAVFLGWFFVSRQPRLTSKPAFSLLGWIGAGTVGFLGFFILTTFVWPWLPGFQFYALRVFYVAFFVAYLCVALCIVLLVPRMREWLRTKHQRLPTVVAWSAALCAIGLFIVNTVYVTPLTSIITRSTHNLVASWQELQHPERLLSERATTQFLTQRSEPFLAPPDYAWDSSTSYLPNVASFKNFGFTKPGLEEWFMRMNDISNGQLERAYQEQEQTRTYQPVVLDWKTLFSQLTREEVQALSQKYSFHLFLTYSDKTYPFDLIAEDANYHLYRIP